MYIEEQEDYDSYDMTLTLEELSKMVDEEYESMSEDEKYFRLRENDPTFLAYCASVMDCNNWDKALINKFTYKCEKINDDE